MLDKVSLLVGSAAKSDAIAVKSNKNYRQDEDAHYCFGTEPTATVTDYISLPELVKLFCVTKASQRVRTIESSPKTIVTWKATKW